MAILQASLTFPTLNRFLSLSSSHAISSSTYPISFPLFPKLTRLSLRTGKASTIIRMGGGPRTFPGGVSKWQWKRMQNKKAKQLLSARLARERQIYEMRKRAELKAAVSELERPWEVVDRPPALFSVSADEQLKVLADRFLKPGGLDLWSENDGPQLFYSPEGSPKGSRVHLDRGVGLIQTGDGGRNGERLEGERDWRGGSLGREIRRRPKGRLDIDGGQGDGDSLDFINLSGSSSAEDMNLMNGNENEKLSPRRRNDGRLVRNGPPREGRGRGRSLNLGNHVDSSGSSSGIGLRNQRGGRSGSVSSSSKGSRGMRNGSLRQQNYESRNLMNSDDRKDIDSRISNKIRTGTPGFGRKDGRVVRNDSPRVRDGSFRAHHIHTRNGSKCDDGKHPSE
ncbi:hypothetical protein Dimus_033099 [Dionaea muscipula]